mmetsp:Transcript_60981/g.132241  ORF Transcript_60981/g.132241 Transcript_60981/m.132241 type:complete len:152 (-) Transcript_60981:92-547(-)
MAKLTDWQKARLIDKMGSSHLVDLGRGRRSAERKIFYDVISCPHEFGEALAYLDKGGKEPYQGVPRLELRKMLWVAENVIFPDETPSLVRLSSSAAVRPTASAEAQHLLDAKWERKVMLIVDKVEKEKPSKLDECLSGCFAGPRAMKKTGQ